MLTTEIINDPSVGILEIVIYGKVSDSRATLRYYFDDEPRTGIFRTDNLVQEDNTWSISIPIDTKVKLITVEAVMGTITARCEYELKSLLVNSTEIGLTINEFDRLADEYDMQRLEGESNLEFQQRTLSILNKTRDSSAVGIMNTLSAETGLPYIDRFFYLVTEPNPETGLPYKDIRVSFDPFHCHVQLSTYIKEDELVEYEESSNSIKVSESIGLLDNSSIKISYNNIQINSNNILEVKEDTIVLTPGLFPNRAVLSVTYPYKKTFEYVTKSTSGWIYKDVAMLKKWILELDTITNRNNELVPTIKWVDGEYAETTVATISSSYENREDVYMAYAYPPVFSDYVKLQDNLDSEYLKFTSRFKNKSSYKATQIIPIGYVDVTTTPTYIPGSWVELYEMHNPQWQAYMDKYLYGKNRNLTYYVHYLRNLAHVGIRKTVVDSDAWNSDAPKYIGNSVLIAKSDLFETAYQLNTNTGHPMSIDMLNRAYYIKLMERYRLETQ